MLSSNATHSSWGRWVKSVEESKKSLNSRRAHSLLGTVSVSHEIGGMDIIDILGVFRHRDAEILIVLGWKYEIWQEIMTNMWQNRHA